MGGGNGQHQEAQAPDEQGKKGDGVKANIGSKWSLGALNKHRAEVGVDTKLLCNRIYDSINKCLLAGEPHII